MNRTDSNARFVNRVRFVGSPYDSFRLRYEAWLKAEAQKERELAQTPPPDATVSYADLLET